MNPLLMVWNLKEVAVKPFAYFYNEILIVLEASECCCESIVDCLESIEGCCETIGTLYIDIFMVLEDSGGCCESMIDGLKSPGGCCETMCTLFQQNVYGFGISRKLLQSHD